MYNGAGVQTDSGPPDVCAQDGIDKLQRKLLVQVVPFPPEDGMAAHIHLHHRNYA